ncbi:hypothetical protein C8J56DRAFT_897911 [Mycena floridula]|nr:hypothetical protein C8J56DRAFT_897911 [Mycena floridula]
MDPSLRVLREQSYLMLQNHREEQIEKLEHDVPSWRFQFGIMTDWKCLRKTVDPEAVEEHISVGYTLGRRVKTLMDEWEVPEDREELVQLYRRAHRLHGIILDGIRQMECPSNVPPLAFKKAMFIDIGLCRLPSKSSPSGRILSGETCLNETDVPMLKALSPSSGASQGQKPSEYARGGFIDIYIYLETTLDVEGNLYMIHDCLSSMVHCMYGMGGLDDYSMRANDQHQVARVVRCFTPDEMDDYGLIDEELKEINVMSKINSSDGRYLLEDLSETAPKRMGWTYDAWYRKEQPVQQQSSWFARTYEHSPNDCALE